MVILAPQLTGKANQQRGITGLWEAVFRHYDINEETYRQRFRSVMFKDNETPVELVTCIRDLAEKWGSSKREVVVDAVIKNSLWKYYQRMLEYG